MPNLKKLFQRRFVLVLIILATVMRSTYGSDETSTPPDLSLEDILNLSSGIATRKQLTARESPGIVSIITSDDIKNSGARDLTDILNLLVPGFNFGMDVEGSTGIGVRGIWANEGKILLLIDGVEANEGIFGNTFFWNHYPSSIIEKVEIIRGPGSAVYGGYATLGVINVITKGPSINGFYAQGLNSQMGGGPELREGTVGFGKKFSSDLQISLFATKGLSNRSDRIYTDYFGSQTPVINIFQNNPMIVSGKVNYRGLEFTFLLDQYEARHPTFLGKLSPPHTDRFHSTLFDLKYNFKPIDKFTLTPRIGFTNNSPYNEEAYDLPVNPPIANDPDFQTVFANHEYTKRWTESLTASWDVTPAFNLLAGAEAYESIIAIPDEFLTNPIVPETFKNFANNSFPNWNLALYTQALWVNPWVNITLGGRFERSLRFEGKFVPRLGLTKVVGDFHAKLQLAQSFRTPAGILADRTPPGGGRFLPETAMSYELELGYRLTPEMVVQANLYDVRLRDVLVFTQTPTFATYANQGVIANRGIEAEYRYQTRTRSLALNYAYYTSIENSVTSLQVPGNSSFTVGFPKHRLNLIGGYHFTDQISLHPSLSYYGLKYVFAVADANAADTLRSFDPYWMVGLNLRVRDLLVKGLEVDLGTHNLLNANNVISQGYRGRLGPTPIESRTYDVAVSYTREL